MWLVLKIMINYQFFPRSQGVNQEIKEVIQCFKDIIDEIDSTKHQLTSNEVLAAARENLEKLDFIVEKGKASNQKINVPVLFGLNNNIDKSFNADALSADGRIVIEVEAGRAVDNKQFLKDIFQACMMHNVEYLVLVVRNIYRGNKDFEKIYTFLETLYISNRLKLPLKGILLIGYWVNCWIREKGRLKTSVNEFL